MWAFDEKKRRINNHNEINRLGMVAIMVGAGLPKPRQLSNDNHFYVTVIIRPFFLLQQR